MLGSHRLVAFGALGLLAGFVACTDPPRDNRPGKGGAGDGGTAGTSGKGGSGGSSGKAGKGGSTGNQGGSAGTNAGSSGSGGSSGNEGGAGAEAGAAGEGGEGGENTTGQGGAAAGEAGAAGESGATGVGGEGGSAGEPQGGGKSTLPAPPVTGVAKPAGAAGNFRVIDWAGFQGAMSFTFDDNMTSLIGGYEALNAVGVPLTFYIVCSTDTATTVWSKAVSDGHELGNHTMHHCNADGTGCFGGQTVPATAAAAELDDCTADLQATYGLEAVYSMAAPYGDGNWAQHASTRFLVNRGVNDLPGGIAPNAAIDPFNLPCHLGPANETAVDGLNDVTDSVRTNKSWRITLNHSFGGDGGYNPIAIEEIVAALTYAKGLGDVWVDTVTNVGAYWRAQKLITAITPTTSGTSRTWSWTLPPNFPPGKYVRVTVDGGTLKQGATVLEWDDHGYYEVALDFGSVTLSP